MSGALATVWEVIDLPLVIFLLLTGFFTFTIGNFF